MMYLNHILKFELILNPTQLIKGSAQAWVLLNS